MTFVGDEPFGRLWTMNRPAGPDTFSMRGRRKTRCSSRIAPASSKYVFENAMAEDEIKGLVGQRDSRDVAPISVSRIGHAVQHGYIERVVLRSQLRSSSSGAMCRMSLPATNSG